MFMELSASDILARTFAACVLPFLLTASVAGADSALHTPQSAFPTVSFRNDVMAVLSKTGCSAGTCHGNKNGKGGFKLSLRGQDPDVDYLTLTRDLFARRTDPMEPQQSLILLKPTTQVAHEGGLRFKKDSEEYEILSRWIAQGMPNDLASAPKLERIVVTPQEKVLVEPATEVQLRVQARFTDGVTRDITSLAVYEPANSLARVSHDGLVQGQGAGETTVLVRYLHCQEPVRLAFVPARPGFVWKNPPLIKELLERPEFVDFWALKWADLLRVEAHSLDQKGVQNFHHWIRQGIAENKPLDQFVRELITARGSTYSSPAANFYRPNRDA